MSVPLWKTAKNLREIGSTALDMAALRYPPFVYGIDSRRLVPVFCAHSVEPSSFEAMLSFLDANGYTTLDADEYCAVLQGKAPVPPRAVVLTFDDGWGSLWSVGFPLIKRYGVKVVVFLAAGRIEHRGGVGATMEGLASLSDEAIGRDQSEYPLLSWEEIGEMHSSGLVDFQSHSYSHKLVCRSLKVVDFISPDLLESCNMLELPCSAERKPITSKGSVRLGEPLFETASRLSDVQAWLPDRRIFDECVAYVGKRGGPAFFGTTYWRVELERLAHTLVESQEMQSRLETEEERAEAIHFELAECRHKIEEMLPGKRVRHLCYPWHEAGSLAIDLSGQVGYKANYWGKTGGRYYTRAPGDTFRIARVGEDFFFRLPGKGRVPLFRIFLRKLARRAREGSPYLTH